MLPSHASVFPSHTIIITFPCRSLLLVASIPPHRALPSNFQSPKPVTAVITAVSNNFSVIIDGFLINLGFLKRIYVITTLFYRTSVGIDVVLARFI